MEEEYQQKVRKISISLSSDVLDWVYEQKGDLKVSTFINQVLRNRMDNETAPACNVCEEFHHLKNRLKRLEEDVHDLRCVRKLRAGELAHPDHVSVISARPKDVVGQLLSIKNVSASNAMAVYEELIPFIKAHDHIDRPIVLKELFPHTRSGITNNINYWYNACRGVLDHLIEQGSVVRFEKNKYRWVGER
jgi:hypothetical protein